VFLAVRQRDQHLEHGGGEGQEVVGVSWHVALDVRL
jgi:hypothetical protein